MLEGSKRKPIRLVKNSNASSIIPSSPGQNGDIHSPNEDNNIMTRKPIRIRRPRIPTLQSGYCAICNLPYNSIEDHVQSKKHQKLIGEDANYIALNGFIHSDVDGIESLLNLTGIETIGFEEFSPKVKRRNMPRTTRASSVASDLVKTPQSTGNNNNKGHKLRSRKNVNYLTPPLDDDSFEEKQDLEPVCLQYKEYRELRSSTRALAKLTSSANSNEPELWESGRPKRACINRQNERTESDNKFSFKVDVTPSNNKVKTNEKPTIKQKPAKSLTSETEKALMVKCKKLRNSELVQLNNEASNFLFPKREDDSDDEDDDEEIEEKKPKVVPHVRENSSKSETIKHVAEPNKPPDKFKLEDEISLDSTSSDGGKKRKKRRSQAEAFIMDNQNSYRLRYHGSYLPSVPIKSNSDTVSKSAVKEELKCETKKDDEGRLKLNLDQFTFSFETVPEQEKWYQTFRRQDNLEERYHFSPNYHWDDFVMPHKVPHLIKPLDPKVCLKAYKNLKDNLISYFKETAKPIKEAEIGDKTGNETESSDSTVDEDSKLSGVSSGSGTVTDEVNELTSISKKRIRKKSEELSPSASRSRNARKSPRQHASTLAILSSIIQQRKRRTHHQTEKSLAVIPEESTVEKTPLAESISEHKLLKKKKVDYVAELERIQQDYNNLTFDLDLDGFEPTTDPDPSFLDSKFCVSDLMHIMYENTTNNNNNNNKESTSPSSITSKKLSNIATIRKPGKRKKNLTGWPNKVKKRRIIRENRSCEIINTQQHSEESENAESDSIMDTKDIDDDDDDDDNNKCDQDIENRVENNSSEIRDNNLVESFECVKKLNNSDNNLSVKKSSTAKKRTPPTPPPSSRRRKRIIIPPTPPKPPRIVRRAKNRWIEWKK